MLPVIPYSQKNNCSHRLCRLGRGEGGSLRDDLLHRLYLIKKKRRGRESKIANFGDKIKGDSMNLRLG